jgi:FkbM family methyltransferase
MTWMLPPKDTYFAPLLTPEGFEIDHLKEALKFCKRFRTAVDGGAHIGTWSAFMSTWFKTVFAFEPAQDTYECLIENTKRYSGVVTRNAALGSQPGNCIVIDDATRKGNTGARMIMRAEGNAVVPVLTVDELNLRDLDFLKLDLEGGELEALRGAMRTIKHCAPTIMVECKEFNPVRNGGVAAVKNYLGWLGYKEVGGLRNDKVFVPK